MSRREKKMQERWSTSIKTETNDQSSSSPKPLIGIDFPQISVLRRKFSSSPTNKKQINPDTTTKTSSEVRKIVSRFFLFVYNHIENSVRLAL